MQDAIDPVSQDFFQGDIDAGLERIRKRLLDLTKRNKLLNFRFTKKSTLRVVDEQPDQLFKVLLDGGDLTFRPVPRPRRDALLVWRRVHVWQLEQEVDDDAEVDLKAEANADPSAEEWVRHLRLSTSYDLPLPPVEGEPTLDRHNDTEIQTLHFPDALEGILANIRKAARLAIEETGVNMLYLSFGYLEWYESDSSNQKHLAPLLLLPVSLTRSDLDRASHTYRYSLSCSGEDLVPNISLQEKMKTAFGIVIPDLEDDDGPESYMQRVVKAVVSRERWTVRRQATLGLLSFGKLLMYRDLDSKMWKARGAIRDHPVIREFFVSRDAGGSLVAPDYEIDDLPDDEVPKLIEDADCSQHSAIIDVSRGKNVVIQGPPGTGKSQTITNLMASAMAAGKTVLFVSEKLAALEVVRHRLNHAGLGIFCLELHSHKTRKNDFLGDIGERLDARGTFGDPADLDRLQASTSMDRNRLNQYVKLINSDFGRMGKSIHEVLWAARRARSELGDDVVRVKGLSLDQPQTIDDRDFQEERRTVELVRDFAVKFANEHGAIHQHPWYGVNSRSISPQNRDEVLEPLRSLLEAIERQDLGQWSSLADADRFVASVQALPSGASVCIPALLPALKSEQHLTRVKDLASQLELHARLLQDVADIAPTYSFEKSPSARALREAYSLLAKHGPTQEPLEEFRSRESTLRSDAELLSQGKQELLQWETALHWDQGYTMGLMRAMMKLIEHLSAFPASYLHLRCEGIQRANATSVLENLRRDIDNTSNLSNGLVDRFDLKSLGSAAGLRYSADILSNAGSLEFIFGKEVRSFKRMLRRLLLSPEEPQADEMAASLRALADYKEACEDLEAKEEYREICGEQWAGADTQIEGLSVLADWFATVSNDLSMIGDEYTLLLERLWVAPDLQFKERIEAAIENDRRAIDSAYDIVVSTSGVTDSTELDEILTELRSESDEIAMALETVHAVGLGPDSRVRQIKGLVTVLVKIEALRSDLDGRTDCEELLGDFWDSYRTDQLAIEGTLRSFKQIVENKLVEDFPQLLSSSYFECLEDLARKASQLASVQADVERTWQPFCERTALDSEQWFGNPLSLEEQGIGNLRSRAKHALEASDEIDAWADYQRAKDRLRIKGFDDVVTLVENGVLPVSSLVPAFEFVVMEPLAAAVLAEKTELLEFNGQDHDRLRERFVKQDRESIELYRRRVAATIDQKDVPAGNGKGPVRTHTELALLDREIAKQKHVSIRQLMSRAGRALQALKPCFMMDPLSVARYLEPGKLRFDLILMDEASQLKPEVALGAIARGSQLVVVGDPMQLPPTSFFDRIDEFEDDEEELAEGLAEAESILDVAAARFRPIRPLRWHYRSQHGSLIAFSNKYFYSDKLVVYPSPIVKGHGLGIEYHYVKGAIYHGRVNVREAQRVVEHVLRLMRERPGESIGVVTLNSSQRDVIENEIEQRVKGDPFAWNYIESRKEGLEPFFVKNLENVQGDERDVIVISVTFGPDASGNIHQLFGPISGRTGHRRLNVLFSRAKRRVELFTSLTADDVKVQSDSAEGVVALKRYLEYARTGVLDSATFTGREPDSPFEIEVAESLQRFGYEVVAQLGVAGFFIDLAVKHPSKRDAFILGIQCDGAAYHSAKSARDRDRLPESVLVNLGWEIHRIWSTDWFTDPDGETSRIVDRIQTLANGYDPQLESLDQSDVSQDDDGEARQDSEGVGVGYPEDLDSDEQFLDEMQGKEELIKLRDDVREIFPEVDESVSLLRDEMINLFVSKRPKTRDEWIGTIPMDMRIDTAPEHMVVLDDVLHVTKRIRP
ncbi:MAG: DUF4011 domain-containing protein [Gemmatimonadetes bacterium]|nr:DUF4011 domain-containing protein [Gemmatimonadota bacterium]